MDFFDEEDDNMDLFIPTELPDEGQLDQFSFDIENSRLSMNSDAAKRLGFGFHLGMGQDSKGAPYYEQILRTNNPEVEEMERKVAAQQQNLRDLSLQADMLSNIVSSGKPMDDFTESFVKQLGSTGINDPVIYFEKKASDAVLNTIFTTDPQISEKFVNDNEIDIDKNYYDMEVGSQILSKQQMAIATIARIQAKKEASSWGTAISDFGEQLIPFLSWYRLSNVGEALKDSKSPFFLGNNMEKQAINFYTMSPSQAKHYLKSIEDLADSNIYDAELIAQALLQFGADDKMFGNVISGLDLATFVPVGASIRALANPVTTAKSVSQSVAKALTFNKGVDLKTVANATNNPALVDLSILERFNYLAGKTSLTQEQEAFRQASSLLSPESVMKGFDEAYGRAAADEAVQIATAQRDLIIDRLSRTVSVNRLDENSPALVEAITKTTEKIRRVYGHLPAEAVNVTPVNEKGLINARQLEVTIGDPRTIKSAPGNAGNVVVPGPTTNLLKDAGDADVSFRFTTAKGSTYEQIGNTTKRNKAPRPEHPGPKERGPQPTSDRTIFITKEVADKLSIIEARGGDPVELVFIKARDKTERIAVRYTDGPNEGKIIKNAFGDFKETPEVDLLPLELWNTKSGVKYHFGNKIIKVEPGEPRIEFNAANTARPTHQLLSADNTLYEVYGNKTVVAGDDAVRASNWTKFVRENKVTKALRDNDLARLGIETTEKVRLGVREAWPEGKQPRNRLYLIWDSGPNKGQIVTTPKNKKGFYSEVLATPRKGSVPVEGLEIGGRVFRVGAPIVDIEKTSKAIRTLTPQPIDPAAFKGGVKAVTAVGPDEFVFKAISANDDLLEVTLGANGMRGFDTADEARNVANTLLNMHDSFDVVENGGKFYIKKLFAVDENQHSVRELLVQSTGQPQEASLAGTFLNYLRSADYKLGAKDAEELKKAVFGSSAMVDMLKKATAPLGALSKKERNNLFKLINAQTAYVDQGQGTIGTHSRTIGDFIKDYQDMFKVPPTAKQAIAYVNFRQVQDADYVIRNLSLYKDLITNGVQNWRINNLEKLTGQAIIDGGDIQAKQISKDDFLRAMNNNPAHEYPNVVIFRPERSVGGSEEFNRFRMKHVLSQLDDLDKEGFIILNLTNTGKETVRNTHKTLISKNQVDYLIVKSSDISPMGLPMTQIPYSAGFHVGYEAPFMLSIPRVHKDRNNFVRYSGDMNIAALNTTADSRRAERVFGKARELLHKVVTRELELAKGLKGKAKKAALQADATYTQAVAELKAHFKKEMPMSEKAFRGIYKKDDGSFDMDLLSAPILARRQGTDTMSYNKLADKYSGQGTFIDTRSSIHDPLGGALNFKWARERNLPVSEIDFESASPRMVQPHFIDAYKTVNDSAKSLMFGRYMDDVKHRLANEYVERFKDVLEDPIDVMRRNPYDALLNSKIRDNVPPGERALAKNMRRTVMEVLGMKTETQRSLDFIKQHVADLIYERYGDNGLRKAEKAFNLVDNATFGLLTDPVKLARNVAFHTKLGFFNPAQLFLQMQSVHHTMALLPSGTRMDAWRYGLFAHKLRGMNAKQQSAVIKKYAAKMDLDANQLQEAITAFDSTGFKHVGREVAVLDDYLDGKILLNRAEQLLEHGTIFFRSGEEISRSIAWMGAYQEWRRANPRAIFNDDAIGKVLARADDLTNNMSSASKASWQTGIMSVPTQFWSYQARLMEQFLGKGKIDNKLRALTWYGIMYGIPVGVGGAALGGVWPIHESIREYLIEQGIDVDSNKIANFMANGLQEVALNWAAGTDLNISERWGAGGNTVIRDLMKGDKSVLEALSGVSGSSVFGLIKSADPFLAMITKGAAVTEGDVHDFLSNISTYNQGRRALAAYTSSSYIAKSGQTVRLGTLKPTDAALMGLWGAIPNDVTNTYAMMSVVGQYNKEKKNVEADIKKEYRRMVDAWDNGHMEEARKYGARIKLMSDGLFTPVELARLEREALSQIDPDLMSTVSRKLYEMQVKKDIATDFIEGPNRKK